MGFFQHLSQIKFYFEQQHKTGNSVQLFSLSAN